MHAPFSARTPSSTAARLGRSRTYAAVRCMARGLHLPVACCVCSRCGLRPHEAPSVGVFDLFTTSPHQASRHPSSSSCGRRCQPWRSSSTRRTTRCSTTRAGRSRTSPTARTRRSRCVASSYTKLHVAVTPKSTSEIETADPLQEPSTLATDSCTSVLRVSNELATFPP